MLTFNQQELERRLGNLSLLYRTLFSLLCSERLFPLYDLYSKSASDAQPALLRSTLDRLWESIVQAKPIFDVPFLREYKSLIPGEDADWTPLNPIAENAVAALAYTCQANEPENAKWAALQGYEAMDYLAHTLGKIEFNRPENELLIMNSPYVQVEIFRQLRDISELETLAHNSENEESAIGIFHNRAALEGTALVPIAARLWPTA